MTSATALSRSNTNRPQRRRRGWLVAAGLILLSVIPVIGGAFRLTELSGGAAITPDNARFFAAPVPIVAHIVGATVYSLLGAFQFVPALRGRRAWHRIAGLVLIPAGLIAALSGLWMAVFVASAPDAGSTLLVGLRLAFGSAMVAFRRRDFGRHGAWMTRAYALGVAAGTQAIVFTIWVIGGGPTDNLTTAVLMGTAWAINATVAEIVIRRRSRRVGAARSSGHPAVA